MTIINPNPDPSITTRGALDARYWSNQITIPPAPDDIYNIPNLDKMFRVKKADFMPFGSVAGFTQESKVLEPYFYPWINENSFFIDCGACFGQYSLRALSLGAKVVAFEPDPRLIKALNVNIDLNPGFRERFVLYEGAVGHENAIVSMDDLESVPMINLDYFIEIYQPTFMKIDVEGMEGVVIEGAVKMLEKYKPKLLIENHGNLGSNITLSYEAAERIKERTRKMVTILTSLGYKYEMGPETENTYFTFCY